jgi:protein-tyrosine phosphatase
MKTELHWVQGPWPGRLAIMSRPRGGDWLEDEVRGWQRSGINAVLSLLTPDEIADLDLAEEAHLCQANGIEFVAFPIEDRGVPPSRTATAELLTELIKKLAGGQNLAIHCRQGIGRAALIAACLLILGNVDPDTAIQRISEARGCPVPETSEQKQWIASFARAVTHR